MKATYVAAEALNAGPSRVDEWVVGVDNGNHVDVALLEFVTQLLVRGNLAMAGSLTKARSLGNDPAKGILHAYRKGADDADDDNFLALPRLRRVLHRFSNTRCESLRSQQMRSLRLTCPADHLKLRISITLFRGRLGEY